MLEASVLMLEACVLLNWTQLGDLAYSLFDRFRPLVRTIDLFNRPAPGALSFTHIYPC